MLLLRLGPNVSLLHVFFLSLMAAAHTGVYTAKVPLSHLCLQPPQFSI